MVKKFRIIKDEKGWKLVNKRRKQLETLINHLERNITSLLRTGTDIKTAVIVKYDKDTSNETLNSRDVNYLMFATVCFLEDYLSKTSFNKYYKKYKGD